MNLKKIIVAMATTKNETCIWWLHGNCYFSAGIAHLVGWIFTGGDNEQMFG